MVTPSLAISGAAAAYRAAMGGAEAVSQGAGFGEALSRAAQNAIDIGRSADAASTQALTGQGSVTDVVLAISRAELALQTATAVRDRVVTAYQDVMRMPI
ncbi:flagellar hook-basal body complex protein FliE [Sediminicoccus sp. KRV36]|uniref:flagellar hook-basal body complex protein FliE n=1 Tax=Sediminicoccus sp. KRV36 TaxID=3133721 RepID=UPI00201060D2|nr:flagellar hook-basal body complex protein FliE [Sediminicoccus rosea]UPY38721.1 flagellar hook-basal body complex protein FliE [Sediminicoccus rosea]